MESPEEMDSESARCKDEKRKEDTFVFWRQVSECVPIDMNITLGSVLQEFSF